MKRTWKFLGNVHGGNIVGSFVNVRFVGLGEHTTLAKIDTGAFSGAIHATDIREHVTTKGEKVLAFNPLGNKSSRVQVTAYSRRKVRSSNGEADERFVINTEVEVDGTVYPITITLADRSTMKYKALIGRKFLRSHGFVVDPRHSDS